jgi:hypothetical protein
VIWRGRQDIRGVLFIIEVTEVLVWPGKKELLLIFHLVKLLVTIIPLDLTDLNDMSREV